MLKETIFLVLCVYKLWSVEGARILAVFPTPSISHQIVFRPLTQELAKRGHNVTIITTDPAFPAGNVPENMTEIDIHDLAYGMWKKTLENESYGNKNDIFSQLSEMLKVLSVIFENLISTEVFQDIILKRYGEFDLLILESCVKSTLMLSHIFKVPVILVSSFGGMQYILDLVGAPSHPLLYPVQHHQRLYNLTNWEKLQQLYYHWWCEYYINSVEEEDTRMLKRTLGKDFPTVRELYSNVDLVFLNVHTVFVDNQPVPPNLIYVGGMFKGPTDKLPLDIQNYLDSSNNGVIYFSFGTNASPSLLPAEKMTMLVNALSKLPYDVLMKWENDTLPGNPKNIVTFKWLPQPAVLKHRNVKLFITQAGLQSTDDAISAGVPLVGIPLLVDQWYNAEKYARHRIGVTLDLGTLNEVEFTKAINTVLGDKSYRDNIRRLRILMEDEPQNPLDRAVWWTEYALRHGGAKHLRAAGANLTWTQYLELDLAAIVVSVFLSAVTLIFSVTYTIYRLLSESNVFKLKKKIN